MSHSKKRKGHNVTLPLVRSHPEGSRQIEGDEEIAKELQDMFPFWLNFPTPRQAELLPAASVSTLD